MKTEEFHKPFIQGLMIVAIITVFSIVSSRFLVDYYLNSLIISQKNTEYSSQKSQEQSISASDKVY
jgi:hypothetical protein